MNRAGSISVPLWSAVAMPPLWAPGGWLAARRESRSAKRRRAAALQIRPFPHRDRRHSTPGSWPQRAIREPWDLSMNRKGRAGSPLPAALSGRHEGEPPKVGAQRSARPTNCPGSWSQCAVREPWDLSMNREGRAGSPLPAALPGLPDGEPYRPAHCGVRALPPAPVQGPNMCSIFGKIPSP